MAAIPPEINVTVNHYHHDAPAATVDESAIILDFLVRIDPEVLDVAVNAALQVEVGSYPELALRVLRGWAGG